MKIPISKLTIISIIIGVFGVSILLFGINKDFLSIGKFFASTVSSLKVSSIMSPTPTLSPTPSFNPVKSDEFKLSKLKHNTVLIKTNLGVVSVRLYSARENIYEVIDGMQDCGREVGDSESYGYYTLKTFLNNKELSSQVISFDEDKFPTSPSKSKMEYAFYDPDLHVNDILNFVNGDHSHSGLKLIQLPNISESVIGIYQYLDCRDRLVRLYRVGQDSKLTPIIFNLDANTHTPLQLINSQGIINIKDGLLRFCTWSPWEQAWGTFCQVFKYNEGNLDFIRTDHYDDPIDYTSGK
jgi:hypothetical protein